MPEYKLSFSEDIPDEDESRQRTLDELSAFAATMNNRPLAIITLDQEQSRLWDEEGDIDYQQEFSQQIIAQIADGTTETLVIRNSEGLPVALGSITENDGWQGLGIDKRLRFEIATMLQNDETEFD
ncbi:MAG TPA: hypothetical protein EYP34_14775 [Chromatiaceae bacterium]|nr:hypothetical protein [Chromatiaceae bacterium]